MLVFHANTAEDAYALEELHNYLGLVTSEPVHFFAGDLPGETGRPKPKAAVHFPARGGLETIPGQIVCGGGENRLTIHADLLGFICDTLSCKTEQNAPLDAWGRVPLAHAQAYRQGLHQTAYLDRLMEGFMGELGRYLSSQGIGWERRRAFEGPVACVTHDVDAMGGKSWLRYAAWFARAAASGDRQQIKRAARRIAEFRRAKWDPLFPVEMFLGDETGHGYRHTFFVLSLPLTMGREGWRYAIKSRGVGRRLKQLESRGHELALHPSCRSKSSAPKLRREMNRLLTSTKVPRQRLGARNHYLRASFPETWRLEQRLGFYYDSTLGWAEAPGFRVGSARPYRPFDHQKRQRLDLWELPLVLMDGALAGGAEEIAAVAKKLSAECFEHSSPATTLWHTNRLLPFDFPEHARAYSDLMEFYEQSGCQEITAGEVVEGFRRHEQKMAGNRRLASESH